MSPRAVSVESTIFFVVPGAGACPEQHCLFADESGNVDFSRGRRATRFFAIGTVYLAGDGAVEALRRDLLSLWNDLAWRGVVDAGGFHASEDKHAVRDEVFEVLRGSSAGG